MADQVFGAGLNGDIDTKLQRFEQHPRRPGVVDHNDGFWSDAAHRRNDRRNIMNFHGDGTGGFEEHHAGVRLYQTGDIAADERVEPAGGDAEFGEDFGAEILGRFIGGVGHQNMVALLDKRQNGIGDRRRAAGKERAAGAAFQLAHRFLERKVGQRPATPVEQLAFGAVAGGVFFRFDGVENQR